MLAITHFCPRASAAEPLQTRSFDRSRAFVVAAAVFRRLRMFALFHQIVYKQTCDMWFIRSLLRPERASSPVFSQLICVR